MPERFYFIGKISELTQKHTKAKFRWNFS